MAKLSSKDVEELVRLEYQGATFQPRDWEAEAESLHGVESEEGQGPRWGRWVVGTALLLLAVQLLPQAVMFFGTLWINWRYPI